MVRLNCANAWPHLIVRALECRGGNACVWRAVATTAILIRAEELVSLWWGSTPRGFVSGYARCIGGRVVSRVEGRSCDQQ